MGGGSAGRANNIFAFLGNAVLPGNEILTICCRDLAGSMKDMKYAKKICKRIRRMRKKGRRKRLGSKKDKKGKLRKNKRKASKKYKDLA